MVKFLFDIGYFVVGIVAGNLIAKYSKGIYTVIFSKDDSDIEFDLKNYEIVCDGDADCCEEEE